MFGWKSSLPKIDGKKQNESEDSKETITLRLDQSADGYEMSPYHLENDLTVHSYTLIAKENNVVAVIPMADEKYTLEGNDIEDCLEPYGACTVWYGVQLERVKDE